MRLRTVFIVLLIVVLLIGLGPALLAVGARRSPKPSAARGISTG